MIQKYDNMTLSCYGKRVGTITNLTNVSSGEFMETYDIKPDAVDDFGLTAFISSLIFIFFALVRVIKYIRHSNEINEQIWSIKKTAFEEE